MKPIRKAAPLLPSDSKYDGPLFFVIAIIVFLASLAAVSTFLAMQNVAYWKQALQSEMTIQILSGDTNEAYRAVQGISKIPGIQSARLATRDEAKALLEPWLGAENIPDDLPIPLLIYVKQTRADSAMVQTVAAGLTQMNIEASIDDHQRWAGALAASARAVQILSISVLALLVTASIAITGFATRAALAARRDLVNVLHLVGAKDRVISRLFGRRFVILGLKAGAAGAMMGAISIGILWASNHSGIGLSVRIAQFELSHVLLLFPVPFLTALVGGLVAYRSVLTQLRKQH